MGLAGCLAAVLGFGWVAGAGSFVKLVHYFYVSLLGETTLDQGLHIPILFGPLVCSSCWSCGGMSKGDTNHHELPAQSGSKVSNL